MNGQHATPHPGNVSAPDSRMAQSETGSRVERRRNKTASEGARDRVPSRIHHERDFGIGYGASHGYADEEKYADSWAKTPFRIS